MWAWIISHERVILIKYRFASDDFRWLHFFVALFLTLIGKEIKFCNFFFWIFALKIKQQSFSSWKIVFSPLQK